MKILVVKTWVALAPGTSGTAPDPVVTTHNVIIDDAWGQMTLDYNHWFAVTDTDGVEHFATDQFTRTPDAAITAAELYQTNGHVLTLAQIVHGANSSTKVGFADDNSLNYQSSNLVAS